MLFENPALAAKLPFPFNVTPPLQVAAPATLSNMSNPIDNAAAAAAAAAVNLMDQHNRELHHALVASINNTANTINGSINNPAMIKTQNQTVNTVNQANAASNDTGIGGENCNGPLQVPDSNANLSVQQQLPQQNVPKISSSGRSTPNNLGTTSDPAPGKLFVGGLSWQTSSEKLKEYFNMFGTVTDVLIMKDPITQRSRGFGFITFQEPGSVEKVLQVPIHTLDGKKIDPKYATPKNRPRQTNKTKKIFVGGVSQETSAEEVKAYFNQFGTVEETVMLMDQQTKRHRGFGFVTFENEDIVDRVCEIHFHTIKNKKVECKKAQPKDAVSPAAQILQKRIMFGALGMPLQNSASQLITARNAAGTALNPLSVLPTPTQLHLHTAGNAAMAAAQQAAIISQNAFHVPNPVAAAQNSGFGKLFATLPQSAMHSVRYAPYALPASAAAAAAANAYVQAQQHQQQAVASQQQHSNVAAAQQSANASIASQLVTANNNAINANNATHGAGTAAHPLAAAAAQQAALVGSNPLNAAAATYQGYALANVDMQSFQGVDWSSMYGMGMYV